MTVVVAGVRRDAAELAADEWLARIATLRRSGRAAESKGRQAIEALRNAEVIPEDKHR